MSRVPSLGPRGEGWLGLQVVMLALVAAGGWLTPHTAGLSASAGGAAISSAAGVGLLILGGAVAMAGVQALQGGRSMSPLPHPGRDASLVVTGVYARIRHPIYAGLILFALGWAVLQDSAPALAAAAGLAVVLDLKRRREEDWLGRRFPEYAAYQARTRALIPFIY